MGAWRLSLSLSMCQIVDGHLLRGVVYSKLPPSLHPILAPLNAALFQHPCEVAGGHLRILTDDPKGNNIPHIRMWLGSAVRLAVAPVHPSALAYPALRTFDLGVFAGKDVTESRDITGAEMGVRGHEYVRYAR